MEGPRLVGVPGMPYPPSAPRRGIAVLRICIIAIKAIMVPYMPDNDPNAPARQGYDNTGFSGGAGPVDAPDTQS